MKKWSFGRLSTAVTLIAALLCLAKAEAAGCLYLFSDPNDGGSGAGSASSPPALATFEDLSPGSVRLTLTAGELAPSEFIRKFYFNLNPDLDAKQLSFSLDESPAGSKAPRVFKQRNRFSSKVVGKYDIAIRFSTVKPYRFNADDEFVYTITGIPGLTADDFTWPAKVRPGQESQAFGAVTRVGGTGKHHNRYRIYAAQPAPVPEPSSFTLFGLGVAALLLRRRRS